MMYDKARPRDLRQSYETPPNLQGSSGDQPRVFHTYKEDTDARSRKASQQFYRCLKSWIFKKSRSNNASTYQILEGQMDHTLQQQSEWEEPRRPYASTISISLTHTPSNGLNLYTATEKEKKKRWGGGGDPWSGRENLKLTSFCQQGEWGPKREFNWSYIKINLSFCRSEFWGPKFILTTTVCWLNNWIVLRGGRAEIPLQ